MLVSWLAVLTGCEEVFENRHEVIDNSFEVRTDIQWNPQHMAYSMNLTLSKGIDGEYLFSYNIDSLPSLRLLDMNRTEVKSGSMLSLSGKTAISFLLPELAASGRHSLNMEFSKDGISRKYEVNLPDRQKTIFSVSVNPSADLDRTLLTVAGGDESSKTSYQLSFLIDGQSTGSVKYQGTAVEKSISIDFSKSDSFIFELPALDPGQHSVTVTAQSQYSSHSETAIFSEPSRFIYDAWVEWDAEYMANRLGIELLQGEEGAYRLDYEISGGNLPEDIASQVNNLSFMSGSVFPSGNPIELKRKTPSYFILPSHVHGSDYGIKVILSNDELVKAETVSLANTSNDIISVEVDASDKYTYSLVKLTNLRGEEATTYKVSFKLDGKPLEGVKYKSAEIKSSVDINFLSAWEHSFELPYLAYGSHTLTVVIASTKTTREFEQTFKEPKRKSTTLELAYNSYSGQLTLASDYNPYSTNFSVSASITVKGSVTYRHEQAIGIADPQTENFTQTAEASVKITPGITAVTIDNGALKKALDKVFGNTRTDAANWIGNGNARTLHADIKSVDIKFTIHSLGANEGCTPVKITPTSSSSFPIKYTYTGNTWNNNSGYVKTVSPTFTINGKSAASITEL